MATLKQTVKKTGYQDIDNILLEAHKLIQEWNQLQKDIEIAVKFKPANPFNSRNRNRWFWFRSKNKL